MTTADNTSPTATTPQHRVVGVAAVGAAFILTLGVLLYAYGPDDLWIAYVAGLGLAAAMFAVVGWRVSRWSSEPRRGRCWPSSSRFRRSPECWRSP